MMADQSSRVKVIFMPNLCHTALLGGNAKPRSILDVRKMCGQRRLGFQAPGQQMAETFFGLGAIIALRAALSREFARLSARLGIRSRYQSRDVFCPMPTRPHSGSSRLSSSASAAQTPKWTDSATPWPANTPRTMPL